LKRSDTSRHRERLYKNPTRKFLQYVEISMSVGEKEVTFPRKRRRVYVENAFLMGLQGREGQLELSRNSELRKSSSAAQAGRLPRFGGL
jgi:hypothetical protein